MNTVWRWVERLPDTPIRLKKEWIDLTATEIKILRRAANNDREFAELVQAKLKDKNS